MEMDEMLVRLRAQNDLLMITVCSLLSGELSEELIATRTESLIATALNTTAPDAAAEAYATCGATICAAIRANRNL